ncbi:MAG: hypothetical protein LQ338_002214 [Usnochroma carphineum]|nr:MAG: hypothetical protein LQ338_002214 [Usnochroma carphineum]
MKASLHDFVPQLSLRSLCLYVDLSDLYYAPNQSLFFLPQAPRLNPFLRRSLSMIDVRIMDDGYDDLVNEHDVFDPPGNQLVDRVNAIDFRSHIQAKWSPKWSSDDEEHIVVPLWWKDLPPDERVRRRDATERYRNDRDGISFLDVWAQSATDAFDDVMAKARNPYE